MKVQQITLTDMKSQEPQEKKFRQLSDEELEKVNGGVRGLTYTFESGVPEECKDPEYRCSHVQVCNYVCSGIG